MDFTKYWNPDSLSSLYGNKGWGLIESLWIMVSPNFVGYILSDWRSLQQSTFVQWRSLKVLDKIWPLVFRLSADPNITLYSCAEEIQHLFLYRIKNIVFLKCKLPFVPCKYFIDWAQKFYKLRLSQDKETRGELDY